MKHFSPLFCMTGMALALSACSVPFSADNDLQGNDPYKYYAEHPIRNKVETHQLLETVHFASGRATLSDDEETNLRESMRGISPLAVDSIAIHLAESDTLELVRENSVAHSLKQMGYGKINIKFVPSHAVKRGTAQIDVAYLAVIPPDCPDWRMSPVTSYSNLWQGNTKCAEEVNLGLMVADPHDLVRGTGDTGIMSSPRDAKAVQDYNEGKDFMPNTLNAGIVSSGGGGSSGSSSGSSGSGGLPGGTSSAVAAGVGSSGGGGSQ